MKKRAWLLVLILLLLTPLGLLSESAAWGEWDLGYYKELLGFIPEGMAHAQGVDGIMPDYTLSSTSEVTGYYLSAIVGIGLLVGIYFLLWKMVKRK